MPWTIPTYAGTYMGGSPSNARVALFELMRAVNQRQGLNGFTKTQFFRTDGTESADLSMSDILNIRHTGTESNVEKNLKRIRDAVIAMANSGRFTTVSGGTTVWTKSSLELAIDSDLDAAPIRPQEARFWQAMKDALDRLKYGKIAFTQASPAFSANRRTGAGATKDDAWAAAIADTPSAISTASIARWQNFSLIAEIDDDVSISLDMTGFGGEIVAGDMTLNCNNGSDLDIAWTIDLVSDILAGLGGEDNSYHYWSASIPMPPVYAIPVSIDTTLPTANPFVTFSSNVQIGFDLFNLYTDLSSELDDQ